MKKLFLAVAAVAMVFATSCKKENVNEPEVPAGDNEFICVIDQNANPQNAPMVEDGMGTMAHIDANNNVWWQVGDEISYYGQQVINGTAQTATYHTLTCSATSENKAYFSDPDKHFGQGDHVAYYPASLKTTNGLRLPAIIDLESGKNAGFLPMYGTGSGTHYLEFHNICAVLKINIPTDITTCNQLVVSAAQHINGVFTVSSTYKAQLTGYLDDANKTTTINAPSGETFSGAVYVAIPECTGYTNFTVKLNNVNGSTVAPLLTKSNPKSMSVEAGKIYPVNFKADAGLDGVFYFEARTGGATIQLKKYSSAPTVSLEYYKEGKGDDCNKWTAYTFNTAYPSISIDAGKKLYFRVPNTTGSNNQFATGNTAYNYFDITAGSADIGGKLMYLINNNGADSWPSASTTAHNFAFCGLFTNETSLYDISKLEYPSVLQKYCFQQMFSGCSNLNSSKTIVLPAGTLTTGCYYQMFMGCSSLSSDVTINASTALTTSGKQMKEMFKNCSMLSSVSLPNCTSITYGTSGSNQSINQWLVGAGTHSNVSSRVVYCKNLSAVINSLTSTTYLSSSHAGDANHTWTYSATLP